jgi:hypothetical protein
MEFKTASHSELAWNISRLSNNNCHYSIKLRFAPRQMTDSDTRARVRKKEEGRLF